MSTSDQVDATPKSPASITSYIFPLILVVLACTGFLFWRRKQRRGDSSFGLRDVRASTVRLSMEEDGPTSHSFISNNASTDSLPTHALQDLPNFSEPLPSRPSTLLPQFPGRRSARIRGPIEGDENDESSEDENDGPPPGATVFGIGDEES